MAIAVILVLIIFVPILLVIRQNYEVHEQLELNNETTYISGMTTMGRQLVLEFMQRLTERSRNAGETLSGSDLQTDGSESFFKGEDRSTDTDARLIYSSDGTLFYGEHADAALFADVARKASACGCSAISDFVTGEDQIRRIGVAAPFTAADGKIYAVVFLYGEPALNQMFRDTKADNIGIINVVDENANIILSSKTDSPWAGQKRIASEETVFPRNQLFSLIGTNDHKTYKACARALGINDWLIVFTAPEDQFAVQMDAAMVRLYLVCGIIAFCMVVLVGYGAYKVATGQAGLAIYKKRFMIATRQSARAAFEYNKRTDRLVLISESEHIKFPTPYLTLMEMGALVHPQDRPVYYQAVTDLRSRHKTAVAVRVKNFCGKEDYRWYHVTATRLTDKGEGQALTIGTIEDIDERETERLILHERATTDNMTGLSNRAETEKAVNEQLVRLGENDHAAFVLLDLDDFKDINDKFGHDCGDKALIFFAERLRATFRFGDILGRLGGDEFVVYMTLTAEKQVVERRLRDLMESLVSWQGCGQSGSLGLTCSIGVCMVGKSDSFESIYKRADDALYQSKSRGKNRFTFIDLQE